MIQRNTGSSIELSRRLFNVLTRTRKLQLIALTVLIIIASFAEVISLGSVIPFLGVLVDPDSVYRHAFAEPFLEVIQIQSSGELLFPMTIAFIVAAVFAGLIRILLITAQTFIAREIAVEISTKVYERTLFRTYEKQVNRNSSEILSDVIKAQDIMQTLLLPVLSIISTCSILLAIALAMLVLNATIAIIVIFGFGLLYASIVFLTKEQISKNSSEYALQLGLVNKAINEGVGGIRDVLLDGTQHVFVRVYKLAIHSLQTAISSNLVIAMIPRYGIESLGITFIALLAYFMVSGNGNHDDVAGVIPGLGAIALGAQRIFPLIQQTYQSFVILRGRASSNWGVFHCLSERGLYHYPRAALQRTPFTKMIEMRNLGFRYQGGDNWVFRGLNFSISQGGRIGFFGETGSGKSTLLDLMMGLLVPSEGGIYVAGKHLSIGEMRSWQSMISHVPQSIYLSDSSVLENIAFGVTKDQIDMLRVQQAAMKAQIHETIMSLPQGYCTIVGERGVRLSGGQRQRIGIARALYKKSTIIILDEATSALDNETEAEVMESIYHLGSEYTVLIVAHRLTTLKHCDQLVELASGSLRFFGTYSEIAARSA